MDNQAPAKFLLKTIWPLSRSSVLSLISFFSGVLFLAFQPIVYSKSAWNGPLFRFANIDKYGSLKFIIPVSGLGIPEFEKEVFIQHKLIKNYETGELESSFVIPTLESWIAPAEKGFFAWMTPSGIQRKLETSNVGVEGAETPGKKVVIRDEENFIFTYEKGQLASLQFKDELLFFKSIGGKIYRIFQEIDSVPKTIVQASFDARNRLSEVFTPTAKASFSYVDRKLVSLSVSDDLTQEAVLRERKFEFNYKQNLLNLVKLNDRPLLVAEWKSKAYFESRGYQHPIGFPNWRLFRFNNEFYFSGLRPEGITFKRIQRTQTESLIINPLNDTIHHIDNSGLKRLVSNK